MMSSAAGWCLVPMAIIVGAFGGLLLWMHRTVAYGDEDMTPLGIAAARITRLRNGQIYAAHCLLRYSRPVRADEAIDLVKAGKVVFVRRSDAHKVLDALGVPA